MLQHIGTRIGPAAAHPVGVSLMHRPIAEHVAHAPGHATAATSSRPAARAHVPGRLRGLFPGRPR